MALGRGQATAACLQVVTKLLPRSIAVGMATAVASVLTWIGAELSTFGQSVGNLGAEIETKKAALLKEHAEEQLEALDGAHKDGGDEVAPAFA